MEISDELFTSLDSPEGLPFLKLHVTPETANAYYTLEDGVPLLLHATTLSHKDCFKYLLSIPGIDANIRDKSGLAPLHVAVRHLDMDYLYFLLSTPGIDVNAKRVNGETPLHHTDQIGALEALLKAGARPDEIDVHGFTPLCNIMKLKQMLSQNVTRQVELLLEYGASLDNVHSDYQRHVTPWMRDLRLKYLEKKRQYEMARKSAEIIIGIRKFRCNALLMTNDINIVKKLAKGVLTGLPC